MFNNSGKFWNWFVQSSSDPTAVALTVKGLVSLSAVQALFGLLPLIGFHPSFDLNGLGDQLYTITYSVLTAASTAGAAYGAIRKLWITLFPPTPAV